mmetsp:Transcript_1961/g.4488  ORF Transcript_1961/g.4488 Transcript_1961/m.4488 type:complete len:228 (-) Transcript_1961:277-960(-)
MFPVRALLSGPIAARCNGKLSMTVNKFARTTPAATSKTTTAPRINKRLMFSTKQQNMTPEEREEAIKHANKAMKGYVETRILAKQGLLKSKGRGPSKETSSATTMQISMFVSLALAFIISPILGKKIATDKEFREKYVPSWYDFRAPSPKSAWTRQELHDQIVDAERDMRERAIRGEFTPEKLAEMKKGLMPRSDLSDSDMELVEKYGWAKLHPGLDDDEDDEDDDE